MTPEQQASLPSMTPPRQADDVSNLASIIRLTNEVRAMRRERWDMEYPHGHMERSNKVPKWVMEESK